MELEELSEILKPERWAGRRCTAAQALEEITDDGQRKLMIEACDNDKVPPANLRKAFHALIEGSPSEQTLRRHRARICECP